MPGPPGFGIALGTIVAAFSIGSYMKMKILVQIKIDEYKKELAASGKTLSPEEMDFLHSPFAPRPLLFKGYDCTAEGASQPNVPHNHYVPAKRRRPLAQLVDESAEDLVDPLQRAEPREVQSLFERCVKESLWGTALNLSEAIERTGESLTPAAVECGLYSLAGSGKRRLTLDYFDRYGLSVELQPSTYALLFEVILDKHEAPYAHKLMQAIERHKVNKTVELNQSALKCLARVDWIKALSLYDSLRYHNPKASIVPCDLPSDNRYHDVPPEVHRALLFSVVSAQQRHRSSGSIGGLPAGSDIPLSPTVIALYHDMLSVAPKEIPVALLQILQYPEGRNLALRYLSTAAKQTAAAATAAPRTAPTQQLQSWQIALKLFATDPNEETLERLSNYVLQHCPDKWRSVHEALLLVPSLSDQLGVAIAKQFHQARNWVLAAALAKQLLARQKYAAVPLLASTVAQQGRWAVAANVCGQLFARRQGVPTTQELTLCVHSSIQAGKWSSAMFWIERGHARGIRFPSSLYDAAFVANQQTSWDASLSAFIRMRQTGSNCDESGIRAILQQAAAQDQTERALEILSLTDSVQWKR
jgi:hypothetical protein